MYTKEEILKAAEIGEVSMIDAKHIVSLLEEAREALNKDCYHIRGSIVIVDEKAFCECRKCCRLY